MTSKKPVVFAIPLAAAPDDAAARAADRAFAWTLRSILRQTDPDLAVLVTGHEKPDCEEMDDPRVEFVPYRGERVTDAARAPLDLLRKRRALGKVARARAPCFLVHQLPGGILHRRLVEHMRAADAPHGYRYAPAWLMEDHRFDIAPAEAVPGRPADDGGAAIWLEPTDFDPPADGAGSPYFDAFRQQPRWAATAEAAGRPLQEVDFPCCIQLVAHASAPDGVDRVALRTARLVTRGATAVTPAFCADFALEWIWRARALARQRPAHPEVPIAAADGAALAAFGIDAQRRLLRRLLPADPAGAVAGRAAGAQRLTQAVAGVVQALAPATVLEVGAHEGSFSKGIKSLLPAARVVAFEANPVVHGRHAEAMAAAGVEYLQQCVSDRAGELTFNVPIRQNAMKATMGSVLLDSRASEHAHYTVPAVTLDGFLAAGEGDVAIWIDVEGAVAQVLAGGRATLRRCVALFMELETVARWPGQSLAHDILPVLTAAGLVPVLADIQREWQFNALFVRPEALGNPAVAAAAAAYLSGEGGGPAPG
ncbi:FkbM family methyltransferase [Falsiroseomonas sp. CW058]|uniref:FkbM family methyltransferase n=1 Tax=Falsiroseomonas sp. CW058 TaxID=3388664 RepID=UPI003D31BE71